MSPRNVAASVRQRLLSLARKRGEDFGLTLTRYALERFMYRLSRSAHREEFVLKGAMLFALWGDEPHRATRDLDLLGRGPTDIGQLEGVFREIIETEVEDDGLTFQIESVKGERIREEQEYEGVRINLESRLAAARIHLQVDVGFGDVITPAAEEVDYPTLLNFPAPRLRAYPRETVVAEKFEAMVRFGIANSRMKDFYDLWVVSRNFDFDGQTISRAIAATFTRRGTKLPMEVPLALTPEFSTDLAKQSQWTAFVRRSDPVLGDTPLNEVVDGLREFLIPPMIAAARGEAFDRVWRSAEGWK